MNVNTTKNNLQIIVEDLENLNTRTNKQQAYLSFVLDAQMCLETLCTIIEQKDSQIALNFKSDFSKRLNEKRAERKVAELELKLNDALIKISELEAQKINILKEIDL